MKTSNTKEMCYRNFYMNYLNFVLKQQKQKDKRTSSNTYIMFTDYSYDEFGENPAIFTTIFVCVCIRSDEKSIC